MQNKYEYQTASATDVTTSAGAIKWNDLFPAITGVKIYSKKYKQTMELILLEVFSI
jgi:hypothetical protein